jgi:protein-S-isoprenylcysteine O-methyltransferase Ste14
LFAWSGVGAFALSLAYFAWFYFARLDGLAAREPATTSLLWNIGLFASFALHHSVLAREGVKRRLSSVVPAELERPAFVWVASMLFFVLCFSWRSLAWPPLYAHEGALRWLHRGVQLLGMLLMVRSARKLSLKAFAGVRETAPDTASHPELEVAGPYAWLRHPLYLGLLLILFGAPRMTADRLVFSALILVYVLFAIQWEERGMRRAFGRDYDRYREAVRWKLVPGLY